LFQAPYDTPPIFEAASGADNMADAAGPMGPHESFAEAFDPADLLNIPPREWVYGHFLIKQFISVLGAPGGTGKTAYAFAVAAAVALGRPLVAEPVHMQGNVWIYNLEDPKDELLRRMAAVVQHHRLDPQDLVGKLFLNSGRDRPLVIARASEAGPIAEPIVEELVSELKAKNITLLVVDPFVRSHRLEENRNEQIDFAATLWAQVATRAGCAILLVHHFRKGGVSGEADAFRGASALIDASRAAISVARMSKEEANDLGVSEEDRRLYVRTDNAKLNVALPPTETTWLKLVSVPLPNGDHVQTVERWELPSVWDGIPMSLIIRVIDRLSGEPLPGEQYTLDCRSKDRWAGNVLIEELGLTVEQAKRILRAWKDSGLLVDTDYVQPKRRHPAKGLKLDQTKISEMRRQSRGAGDDL
jgi:hypothetical protein